MDRAIRELLERQGRRPLLTTGLDTPVAKAVALMNDACAGSVLVLDRDDRLVGIFTERDTLTRLVETGRDPGRTRVGSVMTPTPVTIGPDASVGDAQDTMRIYRVCHLPVIDEGRVVGVLALRDIVSALAEGLDSENRELHRYIHGPVARAPETFAGASTLPHPRPKSGMHEGP